MAGGAGGGIGGDIGGGFAGVSGGFGSGDVGDIGPSGGPDDDYIPGFGSLRGFKTREELDKEKKKRLEEQATAEKNKDAASKETAAKKAVRKSRSLLPGFTKPNVSPRTLVPGLKKVPLNETSLFGDEVSTQIY